MDSYILPLWMCSKKKFFLILLLLLLLLLSRMPSLCCDGLKLPSDGDLFWLLFSGGAPCPPPQSLNCWSSCNIRGEDGCRGNDR